MWTRRANQGDDPHRDEYGAPNGATTRDVDRPAARQSRAPGIGVRLAILVSIAALAPVAFVVWIASDQIERDAIARAQQVTAVHAATVANTIDDRFRALSVAASAAATIVSLATPEDQTVNHDALLQTIAKQIGYESRFGTFAPDGQRLGASAPSRATNVSSYDGFRRAVGGTSAWEISTSETSGLPSVYFYAPVFDHAPTSKAVRGVVALAIETSKLDRLVRGIADHVDQTGGLAVIADVDDRSIFGTNLAATQSRAPIPWLATIDTSQANWTVAIDGVTHIVGVARSQETSWTVAITMAETNVTAPARRVRDGAVEASIAVGFVAVVVGVIRTSALIAPLSELARATTALASGDASVQLPAPGGVREIDVVVGAFANMRDRVTAWTIASDDARAAAEHALAQRSAALTELQRTRDEVVRRERLHAIGQVVTGLAHDFQGAISTVAGYCEILLGNSSIRRDDSRLTEVIGRMRQASLNASELVDRIRVLSLPSTEASAGPPGTGDDLHELIRLDTVAEQSLQLFEPTITRSRDQNPIQVVTQFDPTRPISGDTTELRAAVTNLIGNAIDAMPQGGTLTVGTRMAGPHVELIVRDTGIGMDDEVRRRCFEPFFTTKGSRGTGIGLAATHATVERHGGTIDLETSLGSGSTFTVRLPPSSTGDRTVLAPPSTREPESATEIGVAR